MKKWSNILKLCLLVISFSFVITNVKALNSCNGESFFVKKISSSTQFSGGYYNMRFYNTTNIGNTYCLDPGLPGPGDKMICDGFRFSISSTVISSFLITLMSGLRPPTSW